jgi:hypothetical protein
VISRHNEIRDELSYLACKALIPSVVRDAPKIQLSRPAEKKSALDQQGPSVTPNLHKTPDDECGDVLIRGLWKLGTDCSIDVRVTDTDAKSVLSKEPAKVLETQTISARRTIFSSFAFVASSYAKPICLLWSTWEGVPTTKHGDSAARKPVTM